MSTTRRECCMKVVNRPGVKGPYGNCKACGSGTRSHVLEPAKYEEYEIVTSEEFEEYVEEFEDETGEEEVELRYRLLDRPTVMCHSCWVPFREAKRNTWSRTSVGGWKPPSTTRTTSRSSSHAGNTICSMILTTRPRRTFVRCARRSRRLC